METIISLFGSNTCIKYFISLLCGLCIDIKHVKITWTDTIQVSRKFENLKFAIYLFELGFLV